MALLFDLVMRYGILFSPNFQTSGYWSTLGKAGVGGSQGPLDASDIWNFDGISGDGGGMGVTTLLDALHSAWDVVILIQLGICLAVFFIFYFLTLPNPSARLRFWLMFLLNIVLGVGAGLIYFGTVFQWPGSEAVLDFGGSMDQSGHNLTGLITIGSASFFNGIVLNVVVVLFFLLLSLLPFSWRLRSTNGVPLGFWARFSHRNSR